MGRVVGLWTLGRACAVVSAVKCINLAIHRPVPLGEIIHCMFIKITFKKIFKEKETKVTHRGNPIGYQLIFSTNCACQKGGLIHSKC